MAIPILDGETPGERLYNAMVEPFGFSGKWNRSANGRTCIKYEIAALRFIGDLATRSLEANDPRALREQIAGAICREHGGDEYDPSTEDYDAADAVLALLPTRWTLGRDEPA